MMNNQVIKIINQSVLNKTIDRCREKNVVIPTFQEQKNPDLIDQRIKNGLKNIEMGQVDPLNLFRISWKNEPVEKGGLFNKGNWFEFPKEMTGVNARIVALIGRWFPIGAHKVGAAYGCLVPRLVSGNFDPTTQKAVWPSTGNYCRGGAFDCALLSAPAIAIMPEQVSQERFQWLRDIGTDEIIATPGCESNVKEVYDKCAELIRERGDEIVIFNQFEEYGNYMWHYHVTGDAIETIYNQLKREKSRLAAYVSATGSAGTIAAGDYLKGQYPAMKIAASEALQCPTLMQLGFGGHRIEGIGGKHLPWIHNIRNTDMLMAVDDEQCISLMRLFNEKEGRDYLKKMNISADLVDNLHQFGISGIANLISSIKLAKYYEMDSNDIIFTILTDSMDMYGSRIVEQRNAHGDYNPTLAAQHYARYLMGINIENTQELNYYDRKKLHNFKYFTWVEQQGRSEEDLNQLWDPDFWQSLPPQALEWDEMIKEFNERTGVLKNL